jgi:hypothetical protein
MNYLQRKANFWVSFSVLAGGMASAVILFFLVDLESELSRTPYYDEVVLGSEY